MKKVILSAVVLSLSGVMAWAAVRSGSSTGAGSGRSSGTTGSRVGGTAGGGRAWAGGSARTFSGRTWSNGNARSFSGRALGGGSAWGNRGGGTAGRTLHYFNHSSLTNSQGGVLHHFNHPNAISLPGQAVASSRGLSQPALPARDASGKAFSASVVSPRAMSSSLVTNRMSSLAGDRSLRASVGAFNRTEKVAGRYYWHNWNGSPYVHYYDGWGRHWYGWIWGGNICWTLWANGWWWWCDPANAYWCYWDNGWLWQNPATDVVYVYENGDYQPAQSADGGYVQPPEGASDGAVSGGGKPALKTMKEKNFASPDGTKTVKIMGNGDAFLYDAGKSGQPTKPLFLATNVKSVKYTRVGSGPLLIQLNRQDGTFDLFNLDGSPSDKKKA